MFRRDFEKEANISKSALGLIQEITRQLASFQPEYEYSDRVWKFYLKVKSKWIFFGARKYQDIYYYFASHFEGLAYNTKTESVTGLSYDDEERLDSLLKPVLESLRILLRDLEEDHISANKSIMKKVSSMMRKGLIHRSHVRKLLPDWCRYDLELGKRAVKASIKLFAEYKNRDSIPEKEMTASKFFEYCKVAYLANSGKGGFEVDPKLTGREMYKLWADNRDGGLKEIDQDSSEAFLNWYEKGRGDHPWEIYRGGNTTHIDLYAEKSFNGWSMTLSALSSTRLAETCRIALALEKAGLPFKLNHQKSYLLRLLCDDFVGIIPEYDTAHRGWQRFPSDFTVADVVKFSWFKDEKNRWLRRPSEISPLVYWLPERPAILQK